MTDDQAAEIRAHVAATPERVWTALTDADELTAWYWPASTRPVATSDPVVGGRFGLTTQDPGMAFAGEYLDLDPPRRLVQSWRWAGDDRDSRVTIELTPAGDGTDVLVVHDRLDAETATLYAQGWQSCLTRLAEHLA